MQFQGSFPILIAHRDVAAQSVAGVRLRQIEHELERGGWKAILVDTGEDAGIVAGAHRGLAAIVFGAEAARSDAGVLKQIVGQLKTVHERAPGLPIIALGESEVFRADQRGATEALRNITSVLYLYEDTTEFLARQIMRAAADYIDNLLPPFFKALARH